jgi:hypothetical protein
MQLMKSLVLHRRLAIGDGRDKHAASFAKLFIPHLRVSSNTIILSQWFSTVTPSIENKIKLFFVLKLFFYYYYYTRDPPF